MPSQRNASALITAAVKGNGSSTGRVLVLGGIGLKSNGPRRH